MEIRIALNEEGKKLLKLKESIVNIPVDLLGGFLKETPYKKELLDNSISTSDFEEILKKDSKFASKDKYFEEIFFEFIKDIENHTNKYFSTRIHKDYFGIEIYLGMKRIEYLNYTKSTMYELKSDKLEQKFANKISCRLVEYATSKVNDYLKKNLNIPKVQSKKITLNNERKLSKDGRFLYDNSIFLKFPKEYVVDYKNLKKIVLYFLDYTWEGIELYKTW